MRNRHGLTAALTEAARHPMALLADRAPLVAGVIRDLSAGGAVTEDRIASALGGSSTSRPLTYAPSSLADALAGPSAARTVTDAPHRISNARTGRDTAIVSARGIALYNLDFQPYAFSTRLLAQTMRLLAADQTVERIILDIDSPGGSVVGTEEAADAVFAARQRKPVTAVADGLAASAAYWIAASATEITVIPSGEIGSVGVFVLHLDLSGALAAAGVQPTFVFAGQRKVDGNPYEPLSDRGRADLQKAVDTFYGAFVRAVARGRGVAASDVRNGFGQGRTVLAREAVRVRMADRVATPETVLSSQAGRGGRTAGPATDGQRPPSARSARRRRLDILRRA